MNKYYDVWIALTDGHTCSGLHLTLQEAFDWIRSYDNILICNIMSVEDD